MELRGSRIFLRRLTAADVSPAYVSWMNDPEVNQYLESRFTPQTFESVADFVKAMHTDKNYLFGIFDSAGGLHIGNIKVGNINSQHKYADIGLLIGEKDYWGKGLAKEAIGLATTFAFENLKLNKVIAGMYDVNEGSYKAFKANGYREVGRYKNHFLLDGKYVDGILVEKGRND